MTDMLEKVARAMIDAYPCSESTRMAFQTNLEDTAFLLIARAAIQALMEPSEEMIEAGMKYIANAPMNPTKLQMMEAFYAMLQRALDNEPLDKARGSE